MIGGKEYRVFTIWQARLFPFNDGDVTVDPLIVDNDVTYQAAPGVTGHYSGQVRSAPVKLHILPLPVDRRPAGFTGAVGEYRIRTTVKPASIKTGEAGSLHIEITGAGNLENMTMPLPVWPRGIEAFVPQRRWQPATGRFPPAGSLSVDIPFVASRPGHMILSPVTFSYFDPSKAAYKTIHSDRITLDVNNN